MSEISTEEMAAMRASLNAPPALEQEIVAPPVVEPIVENVVPPVIDPVVPEVKAEEVVQPVAPEVVKVKTFDEEFAERFDGKYKSPDEIKAILNAPKVEEFADDEVKHWNDLKKKGVKLDKEFFDLQALNLDGDSLGEIDQRFILLEAAKRKDGGIGMSDKTLKFQLDKKYNLSEWLEKDEADLTDEDLANREIMNRDAKNDFAWLKNYKAERTFVKPVDENVVRQQNEERETYFRNFDSIVDTSVVAKVTNLSTVIDDKTGEKFDYKISEADGKEFGNLMKGLTRGTHNLFDQFAYVDDKGVKQYNHQKVFEMLVKNKNYDQAVKNAFNDGKALGAKKEITDLKNSGFPIAETRIQNDEPKTQQEALALEMRKQAGITKKL